MRLLKRVASICLTKSAFTNSNKVSSLPASIASNIGCKRAFSSSVASGAICQVFNSSCVNSLASGSALSYRASNVANVSRAVFAYIYCAGYLGYPFEKSRDYASKIPLSHCHAEEAEALARNIENRHANVHPILPPLPPHPRRRVNVSRRCLHRQ